MRILVVCPAGARTHHGNRITAGRWASLLRELGCRVTVTQGYRAGNWDLLVALHARRSAAATAAFRREHPSRPVVVALTGTDVYRDIRRSRHAQRSLELASRLVVLQPLALREIPARLRGKARVIVQSARAVKRRVRRQRSFFDVVVLGHLRTVKDPLRAAWAARELPADSKVRVVHLGQAMTSGWATRAALEQRRNPRYRWLGDRPHAQTLARLAGADLLVLSSRMEGGANVISEALAASVPVLASRIPGSIGLLGSDYPGYFDAGDTAALGRLLRRAENDAAFYRRLVHHCARKAALFRPEREMRAWKLLLRDFASGPAAARPAS